MGDGQINPRKKYLVRVQILNFFHIQIIWREDFNPNKSSFRCWMGSSLVSAYSVGSPTTVNPTHPVPCQVEECPKNDFSRKQYRTMTCRDRQKLRLCCLKKVFLADEVTDTFSENETCIQELSTDGKPGGSVDLIKSRSLSKKMPSTAKHVPYRVPQFH